MEDFGSTLLEYFSNERAIAWLVAALKVGAGLLLGRLVGRGLVRMFSDQADAHQAMLLRRISFYTIAGLFVASALTELGFDLGVLLGAAGILTVALGFASQTSASNLISGLFLLGEKPFSIGDIIRVDQTTGEVLSIDLLSAKLRTFDNLYVRVPNETLIKSQITNLSRFPIRRFDVMVGVAYKEDLEHVRHVLDRVGHDNPLCLQEPAPLIIFQGFGESSLNFQFSVWTKRENFLAFRNSIQEEIKVAFDEEGIEIPFPHRTLYVGSATGPFPVQVVPHEDGSAASAESNGHEADAAD